MTRYFVEERMLHRYPVPDKCDIEYKGQKLLHHRPFTAEKCTKCFGAGRE